MLANQRYYDLTPLNNFPTEIRDDDEEDNEFDGRLVFSHGWHRTRTLRRNYKSRSTACPVSQTQRGKYTIQGLLQKSTNEILGGSLILFINMVTVDSVVRAYHRFCSSRWRAYGRPLQQDQGCHSIIKASRTHHITTSNLTFTLRLGEAC